MKIPKIGDVYYVDLTPITAHSDHLMKKPHMVLVVQSKVLDHSPLRICVPLTSAKPNHFTKDGKLKFPTHYLLRKKHYDFLKVDTVVKCEQLITLEWKKYLTKYLGTIDKGALQEIVMRISIAVGMKDVFSRKK